MVGLASWIALALASTATVDDRLDLFEAKIRPILETKCARCHSGESARPKANLRLDSRDATRRGGDSGPAVVPGKPGESLILEAIAGTGDTPRMPPDERLSSNVVADFRRWIEQGALDPRDQPTTVARRQETWWSLRPLVRPEVPDPGDAFRSRIRNPIDAFVLAKLRDQRLEPSPEADRRTLIRRLSFDLTGLPPDPAEVEAFEREESPDAYDRLVDRLLESPAYGERWGRHWLDVAHYGDTHGYDKDQPRPNAWPYRDYVIRALNIDKPYAEFVQEQVAGDVLFPGTRDGVEALGFLAAGPWDLIGHAEVPETKVDGQVARLLDRDDMVATTLNAFCSLTAQCARCHDHKFDPVSQEDYYRLQAVFAAVDRADKAYDADPRVAERRRELEAERQRLIAELKSLDELAHLRGGEPLAALEREVKEVESLVARSAARSPAYGYHSQLSNRAETVRWVQVDLGKPQRIAQVILHPCDDDFNGIGPGFGFPARFKVEAANDPEFATDVNLIVDRTGEDQPNPKPAAVSLEAGNVVARFVRVTATRLASRQNDFHFALAELEILDETGRNLALGAAVSALDTIEAPPRWRTANLVDGDYPRAASPADLARLLELQARRAELFRASLPAEAASRYELDQLGLTAVESEVKNLPAQEHVYAATIHHGSGAFRGTGPDGGRPRVIRLLHRGDVRQPRQVVEPGTVPLIEGEAGRFPLAEGAPEGERRAALARWLTDVRNPLTWRSAVNRVWHYHFGRGLVETPSDFGRMGAAPSHPELLDWLACEFRDEEQSLKALHRLIVTSATYRQASRHHEGNAHVDAGNALLWRAHRRRLEAEEIRDAVLAVSGALDRRMGGPGYRDFVVDHPEHSPHYEYARANPDDPSTHRRSVYRFIVRSQPQPFLGALDCADASMSVDRRTESTTALQALALCNNALIVTMAEHCARRLEREASDDPARAQRLIRLALGRPPTPTEAKMLTEYVGKHGLANACRLVFNLSAFLFVD
jgi:hypothetical protein